VAAEILDGLALSKQIRLELKERVDRLRERRIIPRLDVLVATQDPSSVKYVAMKKKWAEAIGIAGVSMEVTNDTNQADLIGRIMSLNANPSVHGVLVQHPLPKHLDETEVLLTLGHAKDVDGITPQSLGRLIADLPGFRCATPFGVIKLLEHYNIPFQGKRALVIGRSVIVGKPMALMLLQKHCTVTIAHSRTEDLVDRCREADILVAAVGRAEIVKGDWVKEGAVVVDCGYNRVEGRKGDVGDVEFESARERAAYITPVPGGVGPMTVATLLSNAVAAAEKGAS
jgi:methylenetetrahydrofolate dehydrogenase (NADP+) / methenyltetrahydrofolate cyclohydrolase